MVAAEGQGIFLEATSHSKTNRGSRGASAHRSALSLLAMCSNPRIVANPLSNKIAIGSPPSTLGPIHQEVGPKFYPCSFFDTHLLGFSHINIQIALAIRKFNGVDTAITSH
jgi:hypothetical protein